MGNSNRKTTSTSRVVVLKLLYGQEEAMSDAEGYCDDVGRDNEEYCPAGRAKASPAGVQQGVPA